MIGARTRDGETWNGRAVLDKEIGIGKAAANVAPDDQGASILVRSTETEEQVVVCNSQPFNIKSILLERLARLDSFPGGIDHASRRG